MSAKSSFEAVNCICWNHLFWQAIQQVDHSYSKEFRSYWSHVVHFSQLQTMTASLCSCSAVLLGRIQSLFDKLRRRQQSGFTAGRSTIDAILAMRLLSELHPEFERPLKVPYLDIKAVFDSTDRIALWKALCIVTVFLPFCHPDTLHQNTGARVRLGTFRNCLNASRRHLVSGKDVSWLLPSSALPWILQHKSAV